jgi:Fur family ferric uptake transcriptional regulator
MKDRHMNEFETHLNGRGLKLTYERKMILDEVTRLKGHFDADSLYARFKKKGLRVSRDTVYRTLPLLLESNVIQKYVGDGHRDFFERTGKQGHHDHMVCIQCGKVIEFQCPEIEKLQEQMCKKYSFQLTFHDHRLFGMCQGCK